MRALLVFVLALVWRHLYEEKLLVMRLPGYVACQAKVKDLLIPWLW
jgi:hypothetical protein